MDHGVGTYRLRNVDVRFPHQAYALQVDLMSKLIESLQKKTNALLESPTGTGKTLCLLCAALAWRESYKAYHKMLELRRGDSAQPSAMVAQMERDLSLAATGEVTVNSGLQGALPAPPIIYYASRTHSQLSQVISELKRTAYSPKISVLGSRDQLCLLPEVNSVSSSGVQNNLCRHKVQNKKCGYYTGYEAQIPSIKAKQESSIIDIENLVQLGRKAQFCPYYASKDLVKEAEVVFLPYNYIIDANNRRTQKLELSNAVIIFDEGHNLESTCTEAASFAVSTKDLDDCIPELATVISTMRTKPSGGFGNQQANESSLEMLKKSLERLSALIKQAKLDASGQAIEPGSYVVQLLSDAGLPFHAHDTWCKVWEDSVQLLVQAQSVGVHGRSLAVTKRCALSTVLSAITALFSFNDKTDQQASPRFQSNLNLAYRIHIQQQQNSSSSARLLSFWCFQSSVAMRSLIKEGVRSIIVASGTLSPLESFAHELAIPFPVTLENPHVVDSSQIFISVCPTGPTKVKLNSSFANRTNFDYTKELLRTVIALCATVSDGVLVFFISYGVMEDTLAKWKKLPDWNNLVRLKAPFQEPRSKNDLPEVMRAYYHHLKFKAPGRSGSVLFAVCRGKLSEGVDFSDEKGRAVLICGIPFPAAKEPRVVLKRRILDIQPSQAEPGGNFNRTKFTGQIWYQQQAARAVNQALGRVIRHRHDFGAVILCDERFQSPEQLKKLPFWVRKYVQNFPDFDRMRRALATFVATDRATQAKPTSFTVCPSAVQPVSISKLLEDYKSDDRRVFTSWTKLPAGVVTNENCKPESKSKLDTMGNLTEDDTLKKVLDTVNKESAESQASRKPGNEKAVALLGRMKLVLGKAKYQQFQKELKRFKAKETDVSTFLGNLWGLFLSNAEPKETIRLFNELKVFLPKSHLNGFDNFIKAKCQKR